MIGFPMTAKQWADALGIKDGDEIVRIMMPFHEIPVDLRPCRDPAKARSDLMTALEALGAAPDRIEIVSAAEVTRPLAGLHKHASACVMIGYADGLVRVARKPLATIVSKALEGEFRHNDGLGRLHPVLFEDLRKAVLPRTYLSERVYSDLFACVYRQIGFLAMGRKDLAAKIAPFTALFAGGVFPLGLTDDNVFVVAAG